MAVVRLSAKIEIEPNSQNARYLATKRKRLGHLLKHGVTRHSSMRGNGKRGIRP
jgi:hypothetical protein